MSKYCAAAPDQDAGTFTSSSGTEVQIDYVAAGDAMHPLSDTQHIHRDFVRFIEKVDHDLLSVSVQVKLMPKPRPTTISRRTLTYDRRGLRDPERLAAVAQRIAETEPLPVTVEPSSRCHFLDCQIRGALESCCPRGTRERHWKPWLKASADDLVLAKSSLLAKIRAMGSLLARAEMRMYLYSVLQRHNDAFDYGPPDGRLSEPIADICARC